MGMVGGDAMPPPAFLASVALVPQDTPALPTQAGTWPGAFVDDKDAPCLSRMPGLAPVAVSPSKAILALAGLEFSQKEVC